MKFKRIDLPFDYGDLEPYIDTETVKVHYDGHHKAYEDKLAKSLENKNVSEKFDSLEELMKSYQDIEDQQLRISVREFGGGIINHNFFWESLKKNVDISKAPTLKEEIEKTWGSVDAFKEQLLSDCLSLFGSGWVWIVKRKNGALKIIKTFNQDNPWFLGFTPIFGIDLWEHAYYLKHKGNRKNYFDDIWNLINWEYCEVQFKK